MSDRMRTVEWSETELGPVAGWSPALRNLVGVLLKNPAPFFLWWGPARVQLYNDACRSILGDDHPSSLGQPAAMCSRGLWNVIGRTIESCWDGDPTTGDDRLLLINRKGFTEETYFRFAYCPVADDTVEATGIGGVLATATETTDQVYGERQLRTLRELATRAAAAKTDLEACTGAGEAFSENPWDVPFALFYLLDDDGERVRLAYRVGLPATDDRTAPSEIRLRDDDVASPWPIAAILDRAQPVVLDDLAERVAPLPRGRWSESPRSAIALPLASPDQAHAYGILICGLNPHREFEAGYRTFYELAATHVVTAIRNARAFTDGRRLAAPQVQLESARQKILEQAQQLARANRETEQANLAKDEFLAMLGHEMRNPLAPILTALQLMRIRGSDSREQAIIERQVDHLVRLVDDLLDISRITRGKIDLRRDRLELIEPVLDGVEIASPLLEGRRQHLDVQVPSKGFPIVGDRDRIAQIISNLLTNAAKYSERGSTVRITASRVGTSARLVVKDEGVGIPAEILERIFEPFVQQPQSSERSSGGLGLGLAIVRSLVELHGGSVSATSAGPGKGSEFVIELPLAPPADFVHELRSNRSPAAVPEARGSSGSPDRILVVDDNVDAAESLADILRELGYELATAHDGPSALIIAKNFHPNVCLLDIGLPVMDGYELAQHLRESGDLASGARIIAITGYGQDADRQRATEAGFHAHLVKPVSLDSLARTIVN